MFQVMGTNKCNGDGKTQSTVRLEARRTKPNQVQQCANVNHDREREKTQSESAGWAGRVTPPLCVPVLMSFLSFSRGDWGISSRDRDRRGSRATVTKTEKGTGDGRRPPASANVNERRSRKRAERNNEQCVVLVNWVLQPFASFFGMLCVFRATYYRPTPPLPVVKSLQKAPNFPSHTQRSAL